MAKLQCGPDGRFTLTIDRDIVRAKGWQKGDVIGLKIVDNKMIFAAPGDIILNWNRSSIRE